MEFKKNCAAVAGRLIFIGFLVQIILGILWMCNAFAGMKHFGEGIVCVGQFLILGAALWTAMPGEGMGKKLVRVLSAESFPMVLQTLMKPDLRVLLAAILIWGLGLCRKRKVFVWTAVLLGICVGIVVAPVRDLQASMLSRMVWTTLYLDYQSLEEDEREKVDYTAMADSTYEAGGVEVILVPDLRMRYSEQEAWEVMRMLIREAWTSHKKKIVKEIIWDAVAYAVPPVVVPMQLSHRGYDSYTGLNYRQFLQPTPKIGKYAMRYGNAWFLAGVLLRIGLICLGNNGRRKQDGDLSSPGTEKSVVLVYVFGTAVMMAGWYTFCTAGRMDYRNVVYLLCLWILWVTEGIVMWQKEASSNGVA